MGNACSPHRCINDKKTIAADVNPPYHVGVKVTATETAQKQFVTLPRVIQARVLILFERLRAWPMVSGAKPLTGKLAGRYRPRTGDYRVQFRVESQTVIVEKIGHRDRFYEAQ